jgi:hypothetical protein
MREDHAKREHGAEIVDEAGGKDDLAHFGLVEACFDHHGACGQDQSSA